MIHSHREARKLFLTLICIDLVLVVAFATDAWVQGPEQVLPLIDLDAEGNLPTWFSSFQLALIAISFWTLAGGARASQRPSRRFLRLCSGFFLLLSIDETALFHERLTASIGSRYVDWVPGYLAGHPLEAVSCSLVLAASARVAYPHLAGLWRMNRKASLIGSAGWFVYITGAAVLETIGYKMIIGGASTGWYRAEVALEEGLEMLGATLILYAVLLFCRPARKQARNSMRGGPEKIAIDSLCTVTAQREPVHHSLGVLLNGHGDCCRRSRPVLPVPTKADEVYSEAKAPSSPATS